MTDRFAIAKASVPGEGQRRFFIIAEQSVVLFNVNNRLIAIADRCPHQGASLYGAVLKGHTLQCTAHGLSFDLNTGYLLKSRQCQLKTYPVIKEDGQIFIVLDVEEVL